MMPRRTMALCVLALTGLAASNSAAAQEAPSPFRTGTNWSESEFEQAMSRLPSVNSELRAILFTLHADYVRAYHEEIAVAQAALDRAQQAERSEMYVDVSVTHPWRDAADRAGNMDIWLAWPIVADSMRTIFENEVRDALEGDARRAWESEVRALRRARDLPEVREVRRSRYAVDLITLLRDLSFSDAEAARIENAHRSYELACDAALIKWEHGRTFSRRASAIAWMRPDRSTGLTGDKLDEYNTLHAEIERVLETIRDVHVNSADSMLAALEDENRAELQDRLDRAWFEVVFLPSPVELAADALLEDSGIDEAQRKAVSSIRERFAAAFAAQHRAIIDAMKRWESPVEVRRRADAWREMTEAGLDPWRPDGPESHHPAEPLLRRRLELARQGCAELRSLFDDHEYPALPLQVRIVLDWPASQQQPRR